LNSLGLSGVSFTGMDVGGFTGNESIPLYTRWIELGAFTPYFRNHTTLDTKSAEPWTFGESALVIARNYISLRYQLLPYLYSTFYESTQSGLPVMRSLAIDYTYDPNILSLDYQNQYEFGNAFMVAPFESSKEYGKIYFPEGTWYDLYNDSVITGEQAKVIPLNINKLPVYVKGSSIIPMQSLVQSTAIKPTDTLTVHIYNGDVSNSFVYYEDDGKSFAYKNGAFYKRTIAFNPADRSITFNAAGGNYASQFKYIKLILHGYDQVDNLKAEKTRLKLQNGSCSFLNATSVADPMAGASPRESCPVKYVLIENSPKLIQLKY
jgi:alpha-glucosidase